jgi:acylphosphatase
MKRAIIIAKGRVQRVGYRDLIADCAMDLGVVGFVENQPDGTVKIVVEGEEEILEEFVRKAQPEDDPMIRITLVDVNYEKATGEFEHFKIKRGSSEEETAERRDTAAKSLKVLIKTTAMMNGNLGNKIDAGREENKQGFTTLIEKQDQMLGKQDVMIEKQGKTLTIIKSGVNEMRESREENKTLLLDFHHDTIQRFDNLDAKYGKIAENMERILEELKEERKEYRESIERLVNAIIESRKEK